MVMTAQLPKPNRWFVSRHAGAIAWAKSEALLIDRWVDHLAIGQVRPCDIVFGTLPVMLAADICTLGAEYWHLSIDLPADMRGCELSCEQLIAFNARLVAVRVERVTEYAR